MSAGKKRAALPKKRTMNLYYKPDRTTRPATISLYVLFIAVVLLGLAKVLVYDLWAQVGDARSALAAVERQRDDVLADLADYDEVSERYSIYSATEAEAAQIDRMEILALLDRAVAPTAALDSVSISGDSVTVQFSGVTLAQTAEIVKRLEASPIVAGTVVNTAATTGDSDVVQAGILIQLQKEAEAS